MTTDVHRSLGAYASFEQLASYHLYAKQLPLKRNHQALAQLSGPYKTRIRGRGLEFEDIRIYQPRDDIRTIDWRVSARTGEAYTKQFREEKERPVIIVVDQRETMFFGSTKATKSVLAADLAAMIAWAAFHKGDRVGGLVFNNHNHQDIRPKRQRKNILSLIHHVINFNHQLKSFQHDSTLSIDDILLELKRIAKPGTQIFFISDFFDLSEKSSPLLHAIARHCEFVAIKPFDQLETTLPVKGQFHVSDGEHSLTFNASNSQTQKQYQLDFETHMATLKKLFGTQLVPLIPINTNDDPITQLQNFFGRQPTLHPKHQPNEPRR